METLQAELLSRLQDATHVIVSAGAGWSADSGLPTYRGSAFYAATGVHDSSGGDAAGADDKGAAAPAAPVQLSYREACRPVWGLAQGDRDRVFRPFWTRCAAEYLRAEPHAGHGILQQLLEGKDYHIYTSNVDGHFAQAGFPSQRITEIHGCIREWQCCTPDACPAGRAEGALFPLSEGSCFDEECVHCGGPARPHIMMFGDDACIGTRGMGAAYQEWEGDVEAASPCRLVILEFGCGRSVPAVRQEGEWVAKDVAALHGEGAVRLYRVNASAEDCTHDDGEAEGLVVPVLSTGLQLLQGLARLQAAGGG